MRVEVVHLPRDLQPGQLRGRACAVFDVLRATTTMTAALSAGVREIRLFADLKSALQAATEVADSSSKILCGEEACLAPAGFDLGNSPGQFTKSHAGATMFMCTTNGTRALLTASEAQIVIPAALVNASAIAGALQNTGRDIVLLCAGTNGQPAPEDILGAGAVIASLINPMLDPSARDALQLFRAHEHNLAAALRETQGGRNILAANLALDIDFAARLNSHDIVGVASGDPLTVRRHFGGSDTPV